MQQPPRHGHGGPSRVPVRLPTAPASTVGAPPGTQAVPPAAGRAGLLPLVHLDTFLGSLPGRSIPPLSLTEVASWPSDTVADDTITVSTTTVPGETVYVLTDALFYGMAPGSGLWGPSRRLSESDLYGFCRFDLLFNGRSPMQLDGNLGSPTAGTKTTLGRLPGWPFVNRPFGPQRVSGFAVYAQGNEEIKTVVHVDVVPHFPMTLLCVEIHGFTMGQRRFTEVFGR